MRLLNVNTLEFGEFHGEERPPYVIASHRWLGQEITFAQLRDQALHPHIRESPGYRKVLSFCEFVRVWGKDIACPSRYTAAPNSRGDCAQCFSRRYKCDQRKPVCGNCQHDGLSCEDDIPRAAETPERDLSLPGEDEPEFTRPDATLRFAHNSCKACATANRLCSKTRPTCKRCQRDDLDCDYITPLSGNQANSRGKQEGTSEIEWIWIDTCCIDKSSSAELGEAINSMYSWYAESYACLAYIHDVRSRTFSPTTVLLDFKKSSWFTRGWTLQELLAPKLVVFLNQNWEVFGHKLGTTSNAVEMSANKIQMPLNPWLCKITGIQEAVLMESTSIKSTSIHDRLKWMTGRSTTRLEDKAYCLLGLCDVFMPLIYGEGARAIDRLEETINKEAPRNGPEFEIRGLRNLLLQAPNRDDLEITDEMYRVAGGANARKNDSADAAAGTSHWQDERNVRAPTSPVPASPQLGHDRRESKEERDHHAIIDLLSGGSGQGRLSDVMEEHQQTEPARLGDHERTANHQAPENSPHFRLPRRTSMDSRGDRSQSVWSVTSASPERAKFDSRGRYAKRNGSIRRDSRKRPLVEYIPAGYDTTGRDSRQPRPSKMYMEDHDSVADNDDRPRSSSESWSSIHSDPVPKETVAQQVEKQVEALGSELRTKLDTILDDLRAQGGLQTQPLQSASDVARSTLPHPASDAGAHPTQYYHTSQPLQHSGPAGNVYSNSNAQHHGMPLDSNMASSHPQHPSSIAESGSAAEYYGRRLRDDHSGQALAPWISWNDTAQPLAYSERPPSWPHPVALHQAYGFQPMQPTPLLGGYPSAWRSSSGRSRQGSVVDDEPDWRSAPQYIRKDGVTYVRM